MTNERVTCTILTGAIGQTNSTLQPEPTECQMTTETRPLNERCESFVEDLTVGREYEVIAVHSEHKWLENERATVVCPGPFTHSEARAVVSKFNPHKHVRIQLREIIR